MYYFISQNSNPNDSGPDLDDLQSYIRIQCLDSRKLSMPRRNSNNKCNEFNSLIIYILRSYMSRSGSSCVIIPTLRTTLTYSYFNRIIPKLRTALTYS